MKSENLNKKSTRNTLLREFHEAPLEAWFDTQMVAVIRNCSEATIERDRWAGQGVPFIKCGRSVRYTKQSIITWLEQQKLVQSTTQYSKKSK